MLHVILIFPFLSEIREFHERADHFIQVADTMSQAVEAEKMRAIGSRNLIKSMSKQREAKEQQLLVCMCVCLCSVTLKNI